MFLRGEFVELGSVKMMWGKRFCKVTVRSEGLDLELGFNFSFFENSYSFYKKS